MQYRKIIAERFTYHFVVAVCRAKEAKSRAMKPNTYSLVLFALLTCFAPTREVEAVVPPPDGGYPNFTTAEGTNALKNLTTGAANTAVGWFSLFGDTTASFNTGVGAGTLLFNNGDQNTAVGVAALLSNTTGNRNTANGVGALINNTTGSNNTANGADALSTNTTGSGNTANGVNTLINNTGQDNTANGANALLHNITGGSNTAIGAGALFGNMTGHDNIALGVFAGLNISTGNNNIDIGNQGFGNESDTIRIGTSQTKAVMAGIYGMTVGSGTPVYVNQSGLLGTATSSARFKTNIRSMDDASEVLLALNPVAFQYKPELDPKGIAQFGLVAEEVAKVNPALVLPDKEGKPYTVRYDQVNAMLLNEFLKEHRKVEKLEALVAQQRKDFEAALTDLKGQIQKVSAQLEVSKPAPQVAENNQ
jgi:Chaperone of endosialidase